MCYNYTENFRSGSIQAKRHHEGKNIIAQVSLREPPRTGVEQFVNLHWSTVNVNLTVDASHIISKDAKAIVPADITPVQHPEHSWKPRVVYPDHSWDQSRVNSITPMTFITKVSQSPASTIILMLNYQLILLFTLPELTKVLPPSVRHSLNQLLLLDAWMKYCTFDSSSIRLLSSETKWQEI